MRIIEIRRLALARADAGHHAPGGSSRVEGLDHAFFANSFCAVVAAVERRDDLALALKRILLIALRQQPADGADPRGAMPIRTARRMAAATGYSPGYISKLASASRVPLGRVIDLCLALRALELMMREGCTLTAASARMGMGDASALSSFIARATGSRPSRLREGDVRRCFARLSALLQGSEQSR
jgi:hypothetical protein